MIPEIHSESERLAVARRLAAGQQCSAAIELLKTYVANNAGSADVDVALYQLGVCYLDTREWALAGTQFERVLREYPESDSAAAAAFRLGDALFGQTRPVDFDQEYTVKALDQWQRYLSAYPGDRYGDLAVRRIAAARTRLATKLLDNGRLYMKLKLYAPARVYFQRVIDEYSDTPVAGDAWLGLAEAEAGQGHRSEAIDRLREVESRFAGRPAAARAARLRESLEQ